MKNKLMRTVVKVIFVTMVLGNIVFAKTMPKGEQPIAKIKESVLSCPMDTVVLDGWASIVAHGEISSWMWDLDGDGKVDTTASSGELKILAPLSQKSSTVTLRVKDSHGNISLPDSSTFYVMNNPPEANVGGDTLVKSGTSITFNPEVRSNCAKIVEYAWDFNDDGKADFRSSLTGNTSHAFNKPGRFYAKFKAIDEFGRETGGLRIVTVR